MFSGSFGGGGTSTTVGTIGGGSGGSSAWEFTQEDIFSLRPPDMSGGPYPFASGGGGARDLRRCLWPPSSVDR